MTTTSEKIPTTNVPPPIPTEKPVQAGQPTNTPAAQSGAHNMLVGGLWCIGGILVTVLTYDAVKDTGGHYIIAWGAILFGGLQFLKGLCQCGE